MAAGRMFTSIPRLTVSLSIEDVCTSTRSGGSSRFNSTGTRLNRHGTYDRPR